MFSFTFLVIIIGLKMIIPGLLRLKESNTIDLTIHLLHVDICRKRWPITDLTGAAFYQFVAIENYPVGHVQTVSEEFLMAMDGILFCAYRLIFMVTSLTICNRFSFNILMNVNE